MAHLLKSGDVAHVVESRDVERLVISPDVAGRQAGKLDMD